jgi:hypothetical protein
MADWVAMSCDVGRARFRPVIGCSYAGRTRRARLILIAAALALVAGCGSSAPSSKAIEQGCTNVADVLSDGPDSGADPVGYAQAQVLPLEQLQISETKLRQAVQNLDSAYRTFSSSGGKQGASQVSATESALNAICPGAAQ